MGFRARIVPVAGMLVALSACVSREPLTSIRHPQETVQAHDGGVSCLALSKDGRLLASGGGEVKIWDAASHKAVATLGGSDGMISRVAFSPDAQLLAGGSQTGRIWIWTLATGQARELPARNGFIVGLGFSGDGRSLVSLAFEGKLRVNAWDPGDLRQTSDFTRPSVMVADVSCPAAQVAWGDHGNILHVQNSDGGKGFEVAEVRLFPGDGLTFSPDVRYLAAMYVGKSGSPTIVLDTQSLGALHVSTLTAAPFQPPCAAFSHGGDLFARAINGDGLKLWRVRTGEVLAAIRESDGLVWGVSSRMQALVFTADDRTLISGSSDGSIKFWDVKSLTE